MISSKSAAPPSHDTFSRLFRLLADEYLSLDDAGLKAVRATGTIIEVECDDQAIQE